MRSPAIVDSPRYATPKNRTRRSRIIPARLLREGAPHLVPLYYLLSLSDLAREAMLHSGSYRFADHLYRAEPSGRTFVGRWIDRRLLALPAARAFRRRYTRAQAAIRAGVAAFAADGPVRILTVPCGIPRDVVEVARALQREAPDLLSRIAYVGLDIDPEVVARAQRFADSSALGSVRIVQGDALARADYPDVTFHVVASTGLGEFLDDSELERFYRNVYDSLAPGGMFYTSATMRDPGSDALLRLVEIVTQYRSSARLEAVLRRMPWRRLTIEQDSTGLQTFAYALK